MLRGVEFDRDVYHDLSRFPADCLPEIASAVRAARKSPDKGKPLCGLLAGYRSLKFPLRDAPNVGRVIYDATESGIRVFAIGVRAIKGESWTDKFDVYKTVAEPRAAFDTTPLWRRCPNLVRLIGMKA